MNKNKSLYLKDNNKRLSNEINNDYLIRDTIVYDILNEHQYYLKSIIKQTRN